VSNPLVAVVVIVAVVVVVGLFGLLARRRTRPLARHLRSASYGRRRSEVIKRQAAEDVAAIEQDDEPTDDL
jgi:hypothetical protein